MLAKIIILLTTLFVGIVANPAFTDEKHNTWVLTPEERVDHPWIVRENEVAIGAAAVSMPLGKILLVRRDSEYCALKFIETWLGETRDDHYSSYEFLYQKDGTEDFKNNSAISGIGDLHYPTVGLFLGFQYLKGSKTTIICGEMKLKWGYIALVDIENFELAPTPWSSIKDVNVHDPRIQWYRKGKNRKTRIVPIGPAPRKW